VPAAAANATASTIHASRPIRLIGGNRRSFLRPFQYLLDLDPQIADIAAPILHILFQTTPQQVFNPQGHARRQQLPVRLAAQHGCEHVIDVFSDEGPLAREHLVEDAAKCPDIGACVHHFAARLLGAHVCGRAENHPCLGHGGRRDRR